MKKNRLLTGIFLFLSFGLFAQQNADSSASLPSNQESGKLQLNIYGGMSFPLGTYKGDIGRAKAGPIAGLGIDKYFKGNHFGIGVDFRYFQHKLNPFSTDTFFFATGFRTTEMGTAQGFKHFALSIGPSFQISSGKLDVEAFLRGGILFQSFPEYSERLFVTDIGSGTLVEALKPMYTDNTKNNPKSWMGLIGAKFSYNFTDYLGLFVQADYLRGFGQKFGNDQSPFYVSRHEVLKDIDKSSEIYIRKDESNVFEYYKEEKTTQETFTQAFNVSLGLKFSFGKQRNNSLGGSSTHSTAKTGAEKEILVVVKDKRTGLALSGVKVKISGKQAGDYISTTNANGEADRIKNARADAYVISGEKNGIPTTTTTIDFAEFDKENPLIYKEIFQDDPNFTLVGLTVECETDTPLPGIATTLSNNQTNITANQISDKKGKFVFQLPPNQDFTVVGSEAGQYTQTEFVTTKGLNRDKTLYVELKLGVCPLSEGSSFVLKNILYDFDKANIRPDAARVLDNLVQVMKQNPTMRIELSSHTDSRGKDEYNMNLSQRRAQSAVNYLISKGISKSRITAKGYGETRLLNNCGNGSDCPESEHDINRRTEVKILKY